MAGLVHLYWGDGKGKTTAAMGLALRALGHGRRVVVVQFLKDGTSGELDGLRRLGAEVFSGPAGLPFVFQMNEEEKQACRAAVSRTFDAATAYAVREGATLLVLDEVCAALSCGFLDEAQLLAFLDSRPETLEVVLTGRNPPDEVQARADYITEMTKRRHPFDRGVGARKGIEL